ncbi:tetraspanin-33-like [Ornithodoros turicata]|uniref:tetraspanin-33-like n=1 Tax=Ornithodoros turicata TaxID=34597 RepID=UPI00313A3ECE
MVAAEPPMRDVSPLQRYPLVIINLLLMIVSGIITAISCYSLYLRWDDIQFMSIMITIAVNLEIPSIIIGSVVTIVSGMGFIGGLRENVLLLTIYSHAMCVLMLISVALSLLAFLLPTMSTKTIHEFVTVDLIVHYRDNDDFQRVIDFMQYTFKCCGVTQDGYHDWNQNMYFNCSRFNPSFERCDVPAACCCRENPNEDIETVLSRRFCGHRTLAMTEQEAWQKIHTRSCTDAVMAKVKSSSLIIIISCSVVTVIIMVLRSMALSVKNEILSLTSFYEKYYASLRRGERKSFAKQRALKDITKGSVETKRHRPVMGFHPPPPKHRGPVLVHEQRRPAIPVEAMQTGPLPGVRHFRAN